MSDIRFHIAPKCDLLEYYHIFSKQQPLGTDIKNVTCYSLETVLYLDIQKERKAMKKVEFKQHIKLTEVCIQKGVEN